MRRPVSGGTWPSGVAALTLFVYFAFVLVLPVAHNGVRTGLVMALMLVAAAHVVVTRCLRVTRTVAVLTAVMFGTGLAYVTYGLLAENPGAVHSAITYVGGPVFVLAFVHLACDTVVLRRLHLLLILFGALIGAFVVHFVLWRLGVLPFAPYLALDLGQAVVFGQLSPEMRLYALSSMVFVAPYLLASILVSPRLLSGRNVFKLVALVLVLAVVYYGGRRALLLNVLISPLLVAVLALALPRRRRALLVRRVTGVAVALGVSAVFVLVIGRGDHRAGIAIRNLQAYVSAGFDGSSTGEARVRFDQLESLLDGFGRAPLVGSGLGATTGYVRSERVWEYELQYPLLLFHLGIVGFCVYVVGMLWIFANGWRVIARDERWSRPLLPTLVGLASFLLANATNPYFQAFGHLWVIALPVAYINRAMWRPGWRRTPWRPRRETVARAEG